MSNYKKHFPKVLLIVIVLLIVVISCYISTDVAENGAVPSDTSELQSKASDISTYTEGTSNTCDVAETKTVTVGNGGDFQKLIDALYYAYQTGDVTIWVLPGTYDIIAEYGDRLAQAGVGPTIGNGTNLIFTPGATVLCEYTGGDPVIEEQFSPLNAGVGSFTIDGMVIRCKNVRYCVHDERGGDNIYGKHIYKNCNMYADNSESSWESHQCIGGGFGSNIAIEVRNCVFESAGDDGTGIVTWHNNYAGGGRSTVVVENCYFKGPQATYNAYGSFGDATEISTVLISGCSFGKAPMIDDTAVGSSGVVNMQMIAWNNEIRSNS